MHTTNQRIPRFRTREPLEGALPVHPPILPLPVELISILPSIPAGPVRLAFVPKPLIHVPVAVVLFAQSLRTPNPTMSNKGNLTFETSQRSKVLAAGVVEVLPHSYLIVTSATFIKTYGIALIHYCYRRSSRQGTQQMLFQNRRLTSS